MEGRKGTNERRKETRKRGREESKEERERKSWIDIKWRDLNC
jgi:hypothetical protein